MAINYKRLIFPARSSIIVACVNVTDCVCADEKRQPRPRLGDGKIKGAAGRGGSRKDIGRQSRSNKYPSLRVEPRPLQIL